MVGAGARIIQYKKPMKRKEWKAEASHFKLPERMPETWLYDEKSWERTLMHNYITYSQSLWVSRMDKAILRGFSFFMFYFYFYFIFILFYYWNGGLYVIIVTAGNYISKSHYPSICPT
jgi:type II restriction/modification system DNA methylase subunit YeeA